MLTLPRAEFVSILNAHGSPHALLTALSTVRQNLRTLSDLAAASSSRSELIIILRRVPIVLSYSPLELIPANRFKTVAPLIIGSACLSDIAVYPSPSNMHSRARAAFLPSTRSSDATDISNGANDS